MKYQFRFSPLIHFFPFSQEIFAHRNFYSSRRILATLTMAGFIFLFVRAFKIGKINHPHGFVILAGGVLALSVFLVKAPYQQYFLAASPFFAMVSAFALHRLFSARTAKIVLSIFALLCAAALILQTGSGGSKKFFVSELRYVLSVSEPEDRVFGYRKNLFRRDTHFFWFCIGKKQCPDTYASFRDYDFDPVEIIEETRPKVICAPCGRSDFYESVMRYLKTTPHYEQSRRYKQFYIRKDD